MTVTGQGTGAGADGADKAIGEHPLPTDSVAAGAPFVGRLARGRLLGDRRRLAGDLVFGAVATSTLLWLMILGRSLTFFYDEWNFIDTRGTSYWSEVLQPHNGHPSMIPYTIYQVLLAVVGLHHYWPYRLVLTGLDIVAGFFLYLLLRAKIPPIVAAAAAGVLMLLGPAWQDLLWAFQIGFLGSLAGGLAALYFVDRRTRRSDVVATICLLLAIGSSGVALPFLGGLVVELGWRRQWRRLVIPVIPLLAFLVWYLAKDRNETKTGLPAVGAGVHYYGQAAASTVGSLVAGNADVGTALGIMLALVAIAALIARPGDSGRLLFALVALASFWTLTVIARTISLPLASRYILPGGVFVIIGSVESVSLLARTTAARRLAGRLAGPFRVATASFGVAIAAFGGLIIYWNAAQMMSGAQFLAGWSASVRTGLGVIQLEAGRFSPTFVPMPSLAPQIVSGPFLASVATYGSPGVSPDALGLASVSDRDLVDQALASGIQFRVRSAPVSSTAASCSGLMPGPGPSTTMTLPRTGIELSSLHGGSLTVGARGVGTQFIPIGRVDLIAGAREGDVISWPGRYPTGMHWTLRLEPVDGAGVAALNGLRCATPPAKGG